MTMGSIAAEDPPAARPSDTEAASGSRAGEALGAEAREILEHLLALMGLRATVEVRLADDRILLEVRGAESGLVIGRKGTTLEALQLVLNKILARRAAGAVRPRVLVDSEGYLARRAEALQVMGRELLPQLRAHRRALVIYGMRAGDRRALHMGLAAVGDVSTHSEGEGTERRLRIVALGGNGRDRSDGR